MKVAFFLGTLNRGGAETLLADIFSRKGAHPFDAVCVYRKEGTMSEAFHRTGVPMLKLNCGKNWLLYVLRFRKLILSQEVDIVHAQTAFNAAIAIISLAFTRVKVITTLHGFTFVTANPLYKRLVFRHSSRIICVSQSECDEYLKHGSFGVSDRFVVFIMVLISANLDIRIRHQIIMKYSRCAWWAVSAKAATTCSSAVF